MWEIVAILSLLSFADCACPAGFDLVRDGECRGLYASVYASEKDMGPTAVAKCKEIQGKPVIIHNEEHQSYWTNLSEIVLDQSGFPIGLECNLNTMRWQWSDGSSVDYKPPVYDKALDGNCVAGYSWYTYKSGSWNKFNGASGTGLRSIYCTTQFALPLPSSDGCNSFEDDSDDGICYQIGTTTENWQEAQLICRSFGADVASIHNLKENSFIRRMAVSKAEVTGVYIGATISGKGNEFAWTDGSEWDYDNFYPGFPIPGLGDCLSMDTESASGQWVNVDCKSKISVACMRKQHYSTPACSAGPWVEGQIIYSPGFPFDSSTPCDFILSVDDGKKVQVEVLLLEANSCCDGMVMFENYFGGTVIANLTGEVNDKTFSTASSNFMRVSWRPNGGVNVRGMMITFRGV